MAKGNLRLYNNESEYLLEKSGFEYPTVSYINEIGAVRYEEPKASTNLVCTYNIADSSSETLLCSNIENISSMIIDGVEFEVNNDIYEWEIYHTFSSAGEHTVEFVLKDNSKISEYMFDFCETLICVNIPAGAVEIEPDAFKECTSLTTVNIPDSVTTINDKAFYMCNALASISIPNSVTTIWRNAFGRCGSLKSIVVEEGNAVYDSRGNCNAIIETASNTLIRGCENTIIPDGITSILDFSYCTSLKNINIPNSVVSIGSDAFEYCTSLTSINTPSSTQTIGEGAFRGCSSVVSVNLDGDNLSIGEYTFSGCMSLTSVYISGNINTIPSGAFANNPITTLDISGNVRTIDEQAFFTLRKLTTIDISGNIDTIGERAFSTCPTLTALNITGHVGVIGERAFADCNKLSSVDISGGVEIIEDFAFTLCSNLTSVIIPEDCKMIGQGAFRDCSSLKDVYCYAVRPPFIKSNKYETSDVFSNCSDDLVIYIPSGSEDFYLDSDYFIDNPYDDTLPYHDVNWWSEEYDDLIEEMTA